MSDTRDLASVLAAADQAAAAGDPVSAEKLLREAAAAQESSLGPLHPDLANTLNNLAVVCEMTNRPADAERYYRKAAAIAAASLAADHPFVATSRKNLEEFCAARGIPVEPPVMRLAPVPRPAAKPAVTPAPTPRPREARVEPPPVSAPRPSFSLAARVATVLGIVALIAVVARVAWPRSATPPPASAAAPADSAPPASPPARSPARPATKPTARPAASAKDLPTVVNAGLCRNLATGPVDWACDRASSPVDPGSIVFYSRLRSPRDVTVQHLWYRGTQLQQTVDLQIRANLGRGYRTYSRRTVERGSGAWRVELRSRDGALLHEERFDVR